jgi:Ni/Co efflux regulator RcnB
MRHSIRSFTTRVLCGLVAAAALGTAAPTAAFADHRDDRRGERHWDHGRHRGRDFDRSDHRYFRRGYRPPVRVVRHGPSCGYRSAYRGYYAPVRPYAGFYYGVSFGR